MRRHVGRAVPADVVDVQVQHVRAVPGLRPGDVDALLPVLGEHRLPERLGAVGVRPLADHQHGGVLLERNGLVQRGQPRIRPRPARRRRDVADRLDHLPQVLRGGAAAAAHQAEPELPDEPGQRFGEFRRGQRVDRPVRAELRQTRIGHHRHPDLRVPGQVPEVLTHLRGAGGAVQPDVVDPERLQRGERRADLRTEQHRPGGLHGDVHDQRHLDAGGGHRPLGAEHRGLGLQQVLAGLDQHRVDAALEHPGDLLVVGLAQRHVGCVTEGGQLGSRADGAQHEPRLCRGAEGVRLRPGQGGAGLRQFEDPVLDVVLGQVGQVGPEGVRLDGVDADLEILAVHRPDDVGSGHVEDLVAALQPGEIVQRRILCLQHRAHRAVRNDDALGERGQQRVHGRFAH